MWVADWEDVTLYAYRIADKTPDPSRDRYDLQDERGNGAPWGIWSDGTTMWVGDYYAGKVYAYDHATRTREARDFNTLYPQGVHQPLGLWSNNVTTWIGEHVTGKVYAYDHATRTREPTRTLTLGSLIFGL